ncbi:RNaseH [Pseudomonas phage vB_PpuP-ErraM]
MDAVAAAIAKAAAEQAMPAPLQVPAMVPGRVLLVDGDYLAYYCGGSVDKDTSVGESRSAARERIQRFQILSGAEKVVVHLTDNASNKGDRYVVATVKPYQGNRGGSAKPKNWAYLRDWMQTGGDGLFKVKTWMDREADDGAAYHAMVLGPDKCVMTMADKDWRMIPGWHIDWKTWMLTYMQPGAFLIDGADGHMHGEAFFWYQLLAGDTADHIPGLPYWVKPTGAKEKLGEARARAHIDKTTDNTSAFLRVGALYRTTYGENWPDALAEQMALLWMRRDASGSLDDCLTWLGPVVQKNMRPAFDKLIARVNADKAAVEGLLPWEE